MKITIAYISEEQEEAAHSGGPPAPPGMGKDTQKQGNTPVQPYLFDQKKARSPPQIHEKRLTTHPNYGTIVLVKGMGVPPTRVSRL